MNKLLVKRKNEIIASLILISIFLIVFFINAMTPVWSDDWAFYVGYQKERIRSLAQVFSSINYLYFNVNGRSVANFFTVLFALLGKNIFNFFNTLVFILFTVEIYYFAIAGKKIKPVGIMAVFLLLWFLLPVPNQTLFWMAGSAYLWMMTLCLAFLLPFYNLMMRGKNVIPDNFMGIAGMFFLGLLAGDSQELTAPVVSLIMCIIIGLFFLWKKRAPLWCYGGALGAFIGSMIQFSSPGNDIRFDNMLSVYGKNTFDLLPKAENILRNIYNHQIILWEMVGFTVLLYIINKLYFKSEKKIVDNFMFFLIATAFFLEATGVFFPYFPPRGLFFGSVALIIFVSRFLMLEEFVKIKYVVVLVAVPFFILSAITTINLSRDLHNEYQEREVLIGQQKSAGIRNLAVPKIKLVRGSRMLLNDPLLPREDQNVWASRFYEVDSIKLK